MEVDLYTPAPIEDGQLEMIRSRVRAALGKEPVIYPYTDPDMIGGIKLRIGDQLIDASVATSIRRMRERLLSSGSATLHQRTARLIDDVSGRQDESS